jgi:poly(A) polymerase
VKFGVTDPISLAEPTEADLQLSARMMEELERELPSETSEGMRHRTQVLEELRVMVNEWMTEVGVDAGMSRAEAEQHSQEGGKIVTLGSFRLGVVHPGSDIDTLCIAPPHVSRDAFFGTDNSKPSFVAKLQQNPSVTECVPIPEAYTPIIKLKMRGVLIDLLFSRLQKPLPKGEFKEEEMAKDDELVKNMDDKSVRCMNGYRVADQILSLVPNRETFKQTLKFIKCWARRRGIYSNVLGFFGGITWSLLVARVCQLYPYYCPAQLVNRFFRVYDQWNWSKPVMLCEIVEPQNVPGMTSFKVWNPKANPSDRAHVMPVITPAFPAMNSTHNVTETTKRILLDEFRRGYEVVKSVERDRSSWNEVHAPFPYFQQFRHFLWLEIVAKTEEVYQKFSGWVESKLRILTKQLESVGGMIIHPNPEQYSLRGSDPEWPLGCGMFIAMAFFKDQGAFIGQTIDLRPALSQFVDVINQWFEKDAYNGQFLLRLKRIKKNQIPEYALQHDKATLLEVGEKKRAAAESIDAAGQDGDATKKPRTPLRAS